MGRTLVTGPETFNPAGHSPIGTEKGRPEGRPLPYPCGGAYSAVRSGGFFVAILSVARGLDPSAISS